MLSVYPNKIFAKDIEKNRLKEIIINYKNLEQNEVNKLSKIFDSTSKYKNKVVNDLKVNGIKLFSLLAFEKNNNKSKFFLDINSDKQYTEKEIFHAEGNAIIYFSNASLRGDLIKYDMQKKLLTVVGNVIFKKGNQYFEASKLFFNLKENTGYVDDIYGVLDNKTFTKDFEIAIDKNIGKEITQENQLSQTNKVNISSSSL